MLGCPVSIHAALPFVEPNLTAVAPANLVPVIVTEVPPAAGPTLGSTLVTVDRWRNQAGAPVTGVPRVAVAASRTERAVAVQVAGHDAAVASGRHNWGV